MIGGQFVLGEWVKHRRLALGLIQDDLAEASGRDQKYISRLENNMKELPPPDVLVRLADALECSVDDLIRAAGYPVGEPQDPINERAIVWTSKTGDFSSDELAIVDAVVDQIRRNKREGISQRGLHSR